MTRIKVCGLTRSQDVELACALGASFVGINFAAVSPRRVSLDRAGDLSRSVWPGARRVGIFVDESYGDIAAAVDAARLDLAQIHRVLREEDLERIPIPVIAVARVDGGPLEVPAPALLARCRAILFDSGSADRSGGSGERFDWGVLDGRAFDVPVFLAGGLDPGNVAEAIGRVRPAAVDVASGVESAPGVKDRAKMERFFQEVAGADERAHPAG